MTTGRSGTARVPIAGTNRPGIGDCSDLERTEQMWVGQMEAVPRGDQTEDRRAAT